MNTKAFNLRSVFAMKITLLIQEDRIMVCGPNDSEGTAGTNYIEVIFLSDRFCALYPLSRLIMASIAFQSSSWMIGLVLNCRDKPHVRCML